MSRAAVKHPAPRQASDPHSNAQRDTAPPVHPPEQVSDLAIASAVDHALRGAPGVVDVSPGLIALVATYGSGRRVAGVVVRHLTPDQIMLEVHVVLSEAYCNTQLAAAPDSAEHGTEARSVLPDIASRIREVVSKRLREMTSLHLARVDVYIDDLR